MKKASGQIWLWLIPAFAVLLPFAWLALHGMASSDDYYDYMLLQKHGLWGAMKHYYLNWSGRVSSYFLVFLLNPLKWGESTGPAFTNILSLIMLVFSSWWLAHVYRKITQSTGNNIPVFSVILCFLLMYIPRPVELIFWFTASMAYLSGVFFISAWLYLYFNSINTVFRKIIYVALPFIIGAGSEINVLLFACILFILLRRDNFKNKLILASISAFAAGSALELFSPGSRVRMNYFSGVEGNQTGDSLFALNESLKAAWHYLRDWSRSTPLIMLAILLPALSGVKKIEGFTSLSLLRFLAGLMLLPALLFPFYYGTGMAIPPDRLLNIVFICFSVWVFLVFARLGSVLYRNLKINQTLLFILFVAVVWQASYQSRLRTALFDIKKLNQFKKEINNRAAITQNAALNNPADTLHLKPIKAIPYTIFYSDLKPEPGHWFNEGYANYHGLKAVVCEE
ncbi:MAG: DUF6056 family protein [Bacteroidia bacterium]